MRKQQVSVIDRFISVTDLNDNLIVYSEHFRNIRI